MSEKEKKKSSDSHSHDSPLKAEYQGVVGSHVNDVCHCGCVHLRQSDALTGKQKHTEVTFRQATGATGMLRFPACTCSRKASVDNSSAPIIHVRGAAALAFWLWTFKLSGFVDATCQKKIIWLIFACISLRQMSIKSMHRAFEIHQEER